MEIKTKFNLNQKVYPIRRYRKEVVTSCPTCDGIGEVTIADKEYTCPGCYGSGAEIHVEPEKWQVINECISKIGQVAVTLYAERYQKRNHDRILYMLEASGVGSGSLWNEDDLFATRKEALAECERRNE